MVQPQPQQNQVPNSPELADVNNFLKKDIFLNLNCHAIGTIQSFNALNQTATVSVNYKQTYFRPSRSGGPYVKDLEDYPPLVDCPVVVLGGGNGALTFPIESGDECIVFFNDRDIDNWFSGSSNSEPATSRLHSFSDAIVLVGVRSLPNILTSYSNDAVVLKKGEVKISVKNSEISLELPGGVSLKLTAAGKLSIENTLGEFVTSLNTILTTATAAGFPLVVDPTALAIFQSFKV